MKAISEERNKPPKALKKVNDCRGVISDMSGADPVEIERFFIG